MSTRLAIIEDRYRLEQVLGEGAQGETFAAFDPVTESHVALKLLFERGGNAAATERLLDEYRYLATLRHPHLVRVFEVGRIASGPSAGRIFFTAELLSTGPAAGLDPSAAGDLATLLSITRALAQALAHLHRAGLLHRDVKPENLGRAADGTLRLFDLGLVTTERSGAQAGSLPYAAPESFVGEVDERADLYSLGVTLLALRRGAPPLVDGRPLWMVDAATRHALIIDAFRGAPQAVVNLVGALVDPEVQRRPRDAREVLAALDRIAGRATRPERRMFRPALVGRDDALTALIRSLDLEQGSEVVLRGPRGAGVARVVAELRLRLALARLAQQRSLRVVTAAELAAPAPLAADLDAQSLDRSRRRAVGAAWQAMRHPGTLLLLDDDAPAELIDVARRGGMRPAACLFVTTASDAVLPDDAPTIVLGALDETDAHALVASMRPFEPAAAALLIEQAAGLPGALVALVRRVDVALGDALATGPAVEACLAADARDAPILPPIDAADRALLLLVAVGPQRIALSRAATLLAVSMPSLRARAAALSSVGLLWIQGDVLRSAPAAAATAARLCATDATLAPTLLAALDTPDDVLRRAELLLLLGNQDAVAADLLATPPSDPFAVPSWQRLAHVLLSRHEAPDLRRQLIALLLLRSRYRDALAWIDAAPAQTDSLRLLGAEIALRIGARDDARARLSGLEGEAADALRARAHFQVGEWDAALACLPADVTSPLALETRALAQMYRHEYDAASASLERLLALGATDAARARTRSLCGMLAHLRGQLAAAEQHFAAALALAANDGDLHAEAVYTTNLAAALREQAHYGDALGPTARSLELLQSFGRPAELAIALFNAGNLELSLGDLAAAEGYAERAAALAERLGDVRAQALADNLRGDLALRRGDWARAEAAYERAWATAIAPGDRLVVAANLVDIAALRGDVAALARAATRLAAAEPQSASERLRCARAEVALALAAPSLATATTDALAARLDAAVDEVAAEGRAHDAFRGRMAQLRLAIASGDAAAAQRRLIETKRNWEHIVSFIPPTRVNDASADPEVEKLQRLLQASPPPEPARASASPVAPPTPPDDNATERLLEVVKRLNSETRLELLLEFILDAAIELLRAERGFLLIDDGAGALQVATARNLDRDDLMSGPAEYSRSIAERAALNREVIVSLDAVEDRRFESSRSVAALHVRSVVAVPLESRSRLLGCLYLDHRLRARAFADRDVALIRGLADHAAVAIENARLHDEERKQRQEVGRLNAELADRVSVQAEELTALRREVRQGRAALELRYNYDKLIGRSPAMLELFRLLDRVTDTSLPVVIYGESGTGKELVARAIHHNGARAARPFVSESCAAIPDTLLESILFGHTRGSFTGADSDRRGLFEVASGGTLFLDEVGEMSPSMQAKLLRVLQQGELRRVGSEKVIKVDVRVVVASNRDLQQLVSTGAFREDLFYRLNVVRVALPSLRQRSEDIPLLVDHFLRKIGEQQNQPPRRVARAALDRLITYQWPGNVRELENEMLRAAALGGELISVADLSPHIAAGSLAADVSASATFDLKERVERLEKALVREALDRSGGNQSKAAEMLGLSRFGLTKKLKRYRMST